MSAPWLDLVRMHAPLLIVLAPLIGAALAVLAPHARLSWALACAALIVTAALAVDLIALIAASGVAPVFAVEGVALHVDGVSAFATPLVACAGAVIAFAGGARLSKDMHPSAVSFAMALTCCAVAGWTGALLARDGVGLVIAVEGAWLSSVALLALSAERDRAALSGALRMLVVGGVAVALMLLGVGFIARAAGSADIDVLSDARINENLAAVGVGLIVAGLALKAGVAPLHLWAGAAYGRASGFASLVLGASGSVGALCVLVRVVVAASANPAIGDALAFALAGLGVASVVIGSVQAVGARNVRRLAAYAGAAQAGCVLVTLALGSPAGNAAALVQVFAHAAAMLALLGGACAIAGPASLATLDGLARRAPLASAAMTFGALSLMGAPLTIGFLGRWRLIEAGVGGGWSWTAGAVIVTSLAAVFFGGRIIERLYFRRAASTGEKSNDPWRAALAPALLAAIASIAWALQPSLLLHSADVAAHLQAGEGP